MLRATTIFAVSALLLLSACDSNLRAASEAADSIRSSAERTGYRARIENASREAHILDQAVEIERQAVEEDAQLANRERRYEARRDGSGWAIYDTNTGRAVRSAGKDQTGLTRGRAEQMAYDMQMQEDEERLRSAAFGLGRKP
jgi:hypothetical protein